MRRNTRGNPKGISRWICTPQAVRRARRRKLVARRRQSVQQRLGVRV